MSWDSIADRIVGATTRAFAGSATITYTATGGSPVDLSGRAVFTAAHAEEALDENEVTIQTVKPTLDMRLADLSAPPAEGDQVQVGAVLHRVASVEIDGEGGALLILEEVP